MDADMNIKQFELMHNTCDTFFESLGDPGRIAFNAGYRCAQDRADGILVKTLEKILKVSGTSTEHWLMASEALKKWRCDD